MPRNYDVTPDGKRFVAVFASGQPATVVAGGPTINSVLNWFEELRRRVPAAN
jgi:hypothetical protein